MFYLIMISVEYFLLAILNYILMKKMNIQFVSKIKVTEEMKEMAIIIISLFWIYYMPKLYFKKGENNK